jgi:hypothetical protein
MSRRSFRSRFTSRWVALLPALVLVANAAIPVTAAEGDTYTAVWVDGATTTDTLDLDGGTTTATLRITNDSASNTLGSASITLPSDYELSDTQTLGDTFIVPNLGLDPGTSADVNIALRTPCLPNVTAEPWTTAAKGSSDFSGDDDFTRNAETNEPATTRDNTSCQLRFANQPNTTKTLNVIKDGYNSTGDPLSVQIFDPETDAVVDTDADVTITIGTNKAGTVALAGDVVAAVNGTATFSALTIDKAGTPYTLKADSDVATNTDETGNFTVADTVAKCNGAGCKFNQAGGGVSYTTTPTTGKNGATFVASLNVPNLRIDCEFAPYNYPASRQPNSVWFLYDDGATGQSAKTNVIVIPGNIVKITPENGTSKYRVCYSSPVRFRDRNGNLAPLDNTRTGNPTTYFGVNWYTGLLPDCAKKNPVAPCVVKWVGSGPDRVGTFLTPPGDPGFR